MGAVLAWVLSPVGKVVGSLLIAGALVGGVYLKGHADGRVGVLQDLAADRITILRDGKVIDHEVLAADDDALCAFIGGCL